MRWPIVVVSVRGPSMVPALRTGDAVLCWRGIRTPPAVRPGDVVVARFRSRGDLLVVKRAVRRTGAGWWLVGDNPYGSDDSASYGPADVIARVVWRYWPVSRFGAVRRRRPAQPPGDGRFPGGPGNGV